MTRSMTNRTSLKQRHYLAMRRIVGVYPLLIKLSPNNQWTFATKIRTVTVLIPRSRLH